MLREENVDTCSIFSEMKVSNNLILRELKLNLVPLNILNIRGTIGVIWYMEFRSKNDKLYVLKSLA